MRLPVVIGQLKVGWQPARNARCIATFLRQETGPGALVVLPEAALSGYDDNLSGLAALDPAELAGCLAEVAAAARECRVHLLAVRCCRRPGPGPTRPCISASRRAVDLPEGEPGLS